MTLFKNSIYKLEIAKIINNVITYNGGNFKVSLSTSNLIFHLYEHKHFIPLRPIITIRKTTSY